MRWTPGGYESRTSMSTPPLLDIRGLKTHFASDDGWVHAVDGVDLQVHAGETVCLVGESGSGKSVTARTVLKLIDMPPGRIVAGQVLWKGRDLVPLPPRQMQALRGREIAFIFQEPMTSLNPVYRVGEQITEGLRLHQRLSRPQALERAVELLRLVGIPTPDQRVRDYPHQFSGGMRQRVMIAMALACSPQLLIADEPTTALDVTIQAQILDLLGELKERLGMAVLLITHAMGVVAEVAQRVVVMYAGQVVEAAPVQTLFARPLHPYTKGLIHSIPRPDRTLAEGVARPRLPAIPGSVPRLVNPAPGCRFASRCGQAQPACSEADPPLREVAPGHRVACFLVSAEGVA
jgi:peptide/nickel transport system ATP-binding protein